MRRKRKRHLHSCVFNFGYKTMIRPVKILYVGQLWEGSTCLERMRVLQSLGCEVVPFDTMPWITAGGRWQRSFTSRFHCGRPVERLNSALIKFSASLPGIKFVWI